MIHVIATLEVKDGQRQTVLDAVKSIVPQVRAENGCIEYVPTVDLDAGIGAAPRPNVVTVVEKWESREALAAHLEAPHMLGMRDKVGDIIVDRTIRVTEPAKLD